MFKNDNLNEEHLFKVSTETFKTRDSFFPMVSRSLMVNGASNIFLLIETIFVQLSSNSESGRQCQHCFNDLQ